MNTKLTLSLDDNLIKQAKIYAKTNNKSVSQLVSAFFSVLSDNSSKSTIQQTVPKPITAKLLACMPESKLDESDHSSYLDNKYK